MAIHASVSKRATEAGILLVEAEGRIEARKGERVIAHGIKAKTALSEALVTLEAERIRTIRDDTEPVIARAVVVGQLPPVEERPVAVPKIIKGSIIKTKYRDKYKKNGDYSCGDQMAEELRAYIQKVDGNKVRICLVKLKEVAVANNVWKDRYAGLNPGQQRMTIGNLLRNKFAMGDEINIGGAILVQQFEV